MSFTLRQKIITIRHMIDFKRIKTTDVSLYSYMEGLLTTSFPAEEYRPLEELRSYTDNKPHFYNNVILNQGTPIGLLTYWDFTDFHYVEHFAIDPAQRNGGYGKNTLNHLQNLLKSPLILEVENPEEEMAIRRIHFYERQGFTLWETPYLQPPYKEGDSFLPMHLMAYGNLTPDKDFDHVKNTIYREVYKQ